MNLQPHHRQLLLSSAITDPVIEASGIRSTPTGIDFPWTDGSGPVTWQHRPDEPRTDDDGRPMKYVFPKGAQVPFSRLRDGDTYERLILVEGTKQQYAVLSHAPAEYAVYGMSGCWGFKHADLAPVFGREVFVLFDANVATNTAVYAAAEQLGRQLKTHGAKGIRWITTSATGKDGVDDALASFPEARRADMMRTWLQQASPKLPRRPKAEKPVPSQDGPERFFRVRDKPLVLQPEDVAREITAKCPAAVTAESTIALYRDGVYEADQYTLLAHLVGMFRNFFTSDMDTKLTKYLIGDLKNKGMVLPERSAEPLLNCRNTMVDLRTGKTLPHDPKYLSRVQLPVDFDPAAECPVYDAWIRQSLRQDHHTDADVEALVAALEEVCGTALDPSRTPSMALFLFGPSRSGKSTLLRILVAMIGIRNTSAVTLHALCSDNFAAANLYGKALNVAADLSNKHVEDLSLFKMLSGEDVINANRKYGQQFTFTNQAMMAFSANELPTVSEASRAYVERMWPVNFPNSFAGREDKTIEARLMAELPGILARWVRAYQRFLDRGGYPPMDASTSLDFQTRSDRVVQFVQDMCEITPAVHGQRLGEDSCTKRRDLAQAFNAWAERNKGSHMGERAFFQRVSAIPDVTVVRSGVRQDVAFNMVVAAAEEDVWDDADEPVEDAVPPTGVQDPGNPWGAVPGIPAGTDADPQEALEEVQDAVQDDGVPRLVPAALASVNGSHTAVQPVSVPGSDAGSPPDDDPLARLFGR